MDRTSFKQRMQSLKTYREQNPGKGYWEWRNSLPSNLRNTDDSEYDMRTAYESGARPELGDDGLYHLPSRDPSTGKILKKSVHPTYWKGLTEDVKLGYKPYFTGTDTYTWNDTDGAFIPWREDDIRAYQDGGETDQDDSRLAQMKAKWAREDYLSRLDRLPQSKLGTEEKEWLRNWYARRREYAKKYPYYTKNMNAQLDAIQERFEIDPYSLESYSNGKEYYQSRFPQYLNTVPIKVHDTDYIPGYDKNTRGTYNRYGTTESIQLPKNYEANDMIHELDHVLNSQNDVLLKNINSRIKDKDGKTRVFNHGDFTEYLLDPAEIHSRLMEFRYLNNLDPEKQYTIPDVQRWRKSAKDRDILQLFPDDEVVLELINTIASNNQQKPITQEISAAQDGLQTKPTISTENDTPMWLQQGQFAGPQYWQVREHMRENDAGRTATADIGKIGKTTTDLYGNKTHYIATSVDDDGTINLGLPDIVITPRNNLSLEGVVANARDKFARPIVDASTYVTPLGDAEAVIDIGKDVAEGNYGQAAFGLGLLALPNFIEKPVRKLSRGAKKGVQSLMKKIDSRYLTPEERTNIINRFRQEIQEFADIRRAIDNTPSNAPREVFDELLSRLNSLDASRLDPTLYAFNKYRSIRNTAESAPSHRNIRQLRRDVEEYGRLASSMREHSNELQRRLTASRNDFSLQDIVSELEQVNASQTSFTQGDVTSASYFDMTPRQAVEKAERDFENLASGQAWNLTKKGATSTDSYPLQLSMMKKYKDAGEIQVLLNEAGNIDYTILNSFGRVKGVDAVKRINKKLKEIGEIVGRDDLRAGIGDDRRIYVPKILFRKYEEGGEVEPQYPQYINGRRVNRITGKPIATGQAKPLFDPESLLLNLTPVGDAITVKDTYDAIKQRDWLTAALAALTLVPFVPNNIKGLGRRNKGAAKTKREVPTVNKNQVQDQINEIENENLRKSGLINDANNQGYKIAERLMEDPAYISRAAKVQEQYGDDYLTTYADIIQAYNEDPNLLIKANLRNLQGGARARMEATNDAAKRHMNGGEFPGMGEYLYSIDPTRIKDLTGNVTDHEWNHYVDYLKNKYPDGQGSSNLFSKMAEDIEYSDNPLDFYYGKPTEQKAYMNQLREYMFENGLINSRDEQVRKELLQDVLNNLTNKNMDSVVRASRRMNSMDDYTKWFNTIPLLGLGALGVNNYYNRQ